MKFEKLLTLVGNLDWFELAMLVQLSGERRATLRNQLSRWTSSGRIVPLRRGIYVLGDMYRKRPVNPAKLANVIYSPSYISCAFALSFHGLIPEAVPIYTSVTTRKTRAFQSAVGTFEYQHVQPTVFGEYTGVVVDGLSVRMASPEKALVDFWYLSKGEWTMARIREMRFSTEADWRLETLRALVTRLAKPRLKRALVNFVQFLNDEQQGVVAL